MAEYKLDFLELDAGTDTHSKLKCNFSEREDILWA